MADETIEAVVTVEGLLADASTSFALRDVLRAWSRRDPVDAANDAVCLAQALDHRVRGRDHAGG